MDFIEYVHVMIYERRLGRLNAHSFSYSGGYGWGRDHAIRHLHAAGRRMCRPQAQPSTRDARALGPPTLRPPICSSPGSATETPGSYSHRDPFRRLGQVPTGPTVSSLAVNPGPRVP